MKITDEAVDAFTQYRRKQIAELRPYQNGEDMIGVSISAEDYKRGSPKSGDMIARNPKNHADQWLVAAAYFAENFEPIDALSPAPVGVTDDPIETSLKALGVTRIKATASREAARRYIDKLEERSPTDTQEGMSEGRGSIAVLQYARNIAGRENEMPRVVACDWLPDGDYPVYLHPDPSLTACQQEVERLREEKRDAYHNGYASRDGVVNACRTRAEATEDRNAELVKALAGLIDYVDQNTCVHENVHRGGAIWTICDECGEKWADDRGGFIPHVDPEPVASARAVLGGQSNE